MKKKVTLSRKASLLRQDSPFAMKEAYNIVRTRLMFTGNGERCPVFAVTSALMHDGKTTNAVNLAVSVAMTEKKVLLIDADMRKPAVNKFFGFEAKDGLSEILAGLTKEIHIRRTGYENLSVLTAGRVPPNPAELLGTEQLDILLNYVREYYDYVIIDTPPVNIVTDASVLAQKITGYIFIVQSGKSNLAETSEALQTLRQMDGKVVGLLLNDVEGKAQKHYAYRYGKRGYTNRYYRYSQKYEPYEASNED